MTRHGNGAGHGGPASGMPASGIPAGGPGFGYPTNAERQRRKVGGHKKPRAEKPTHPEPSPFTETDLASLDALKLVQSAEARRLTMAKMAADESLHPMIRLQCLVALSNRIEGTPVQRSSVRVVRSLDDLTPEELDAIEADARRKLADEAG